MAIGFRNYIHMGHFAYKHQKAKIEDCPFPADSSIAKEWRQGWVKALKGEPWNEPRRKKRIVE